MVSNTAHTVRGSAAQWRNKKEKHIFDQAKQGP